MKTAYFFFCVCVLIGCACANVKHLGLLGMVINSCDQTGLFEVINGKTNFID